HALDIEVVPEQDGDVVAPARMDGEPAPAQVGVIDDVVVNQRGRVNELDHRGVQDGPVAGIAAEPGGHQQNRRTDALPPAALDIAAHLGNQGHPGLDVAGRVTDLRTPPA